MMSMITIGNPNLNCIYRFAHARNPWRNRIAILELKNIRADVTYLFIVPII